MGAIARLRSLVGQRGFRWASAGLLDQVVIACANAANTLLALALLSRQRSGVMLLSLSVAYLVMFINRAFVGDVLLALASRYDGERRDRLVRNGLAAAASIGLAGTAVLSALWAVWPNHPDLDLRDLIWVAPLVPMILLHDTGRFSYLAARETSRALVIDLVWVGTQAVCVAVLWASHAVTAGTLLASWGLGATAGACVFMFRSGLRPWQGNPRTWASETRKLSGWFTATALIGQFQVLSVGFLVAWRLGNTAVSGLRGAQTALVQPVQNLIFAMMGLLVPRASRLARDAAALPEAEASAAGDALRRQTRLIAAGATILAVLMVAILWPLASTVLIHIKKFEDIAPLALPISLQAGIYLVQMPFAASLRAMHRARMLFAQYVLFTTASLAGLVVGARASGLPGAAWGLTGGALVGFISMVGLYWHALRSLGDAQYDDVDGVVSVPSTGQTVPADSLAAGGPS